MFAIKKAFEQKFKDLVNLITEFAWKRFLPRDHVSSQNDFYVNSLFKHQTKYLIQTFLQTLIIVINMNV